MRVDVGAGIGGAELRILPGVGHFPFAERPEDYLGAVERFLAAL